MKSAVIAANNLTKTFAGKDVIRTCNLTVEQGSIYGFGDATAQEKPPCSSCCWGS